MKLTGAQLQAVQSTGNVLVSAGAGAGKTSTMVERCLVEVLRPDEPLSLQQILMVTFTEAAAAEMKERVRQRLIQEVASGNRSRHLEEELARLDLAPIGTLHGFCLRLIRRHFFDLGIDPQPRVLPLEQARLIQEEVLNHLLDHELGRGDERSQLLYALIRDQGNRPLDLGWLRQTITRVYHYSRSLPDPQAWLQDQRSLFEMPAADRWHLWFHQTVDQWLEEALAVWQHEPPLDWTPSVLHACESARQALQQKLSPPAPGSPRADHHPASETRQLLVDLKGSLAAVPVPARTSDPGVKHAKERLKKQIETLDLWLSLVTPLPGADPSSPHPLDQDWQWVRHQMLLLLDLVDAFSKQFFEQKRQLGAVDFSDLEQLALDLMWNRTEKTPTATALEWQQHFKLVCVDEYQDINAAQDSIIQALSGPHTSRFLVGDVKQSIYRFRLANPAIFRTYLSEWSQSNGNGTVLHLQDNFRSHQTLLNHVNQLFQSLMRREVGGIDFTPADQLLFGAPNDRSWFASPRADKQPPLPANPRIDMHFLVNGKTSEPDEADAASEEDPSLLLHPEAALAAEHLSLLHAAEYPVHDPASAQFRPVRWSDIVILLRAPGPQLGDYAREFERRGIPLQAVSASLLDAVEVQDLLNLLAILENPLQDIPLLAVLRSPFATFTFSELAEVRLARMRGPLWQGLLQLVQPSPAHKAGAPSQPERDPAAQPPSAAEKARLFLDRYWRWRRTARELSVAQRLEYILSEAHYEEWLQSFPDAPQRLANLQHLLRLAQDFDPLQRQDTNRFLRFIEQQKDLNADLDPPTQSGAGDAVRIMSIHASKGLEFPVVWLAGLGRGFNLMDVRDRLILDEDLGLCPMIAPPGLGRSYRSLPNLIAGRRQRAEALGEELRLLYVGMTRARDYLLLSGTVSSEKELDKWSGTDPDRWSWSDLLSASNPLQWLGPWWCHGSSQKQDASHARCSFHQVADIQARATAEPALAGPTARQSLFTFPVMDKARELLARHYPHAAAVHQPAKASVTGLRRRAQQLEEAAPVAPAAFKGRVASKPSSSLSATDRGTAAHRLLQHIQLDKTGSREEVQREMERLQSLNLLSADEAAAIELDLIHQFWQSEAGLLLRKHAQKVERELPFTARLKPDQLAALGLLQWTGAPDEFIIVQGFVDAAILLPQSIFIVDYKTDAVDAASAAERSAHYRPQLLLYAQALQLIYRRPVKKTWLYWIQPGLLQELQAPSC